MWILLLADMKGSRILSRSERHHSSMYCPIFNMHDAGQVKRVPFVLSQCQDDLSDILVNAFNHANSSRTALKQACKTSLAECQWCGKIICHACPYMHVHQPASTKTHKQANEMNVQCDATRHAACQSLNPGHIGDLFQPNGSIFHADSLLCRECEQHYHDLPLKP